MYNKGAASGHLARLVQRDNIRIVTELVRVKLKTSDYDSPLGVLWSSLGPAVMLLVLYVMFHTRFAEGVRNYALYLLTGIVMVNFFITVTSQILKAFNENREMLLNSVVPREDVVAVELLVYLYKFLIECAVCIGLSMAYAGMPWYGILLAVPLVAAYIGFTLGVGCVLLVLYSFARDVEHLWGIAGRFVYFVTPVFFTLHSISWWARTAVLVGNPLTAFVVALRGVLLERAPTVTGWYWYSIGLGLAGLIGGYLLFRALEDTALERA